MAEKRIDVFYQAPGKAEWQHVESWASERVKGPREVARGLLAEADAAAARMIFAARPRGLTPEEAFEQQMAKALGAWGRYVEVEVKKFGRSAEAAIDDLLLGKKR